MSFSVIGKAAAHGRSMDSVNRGPVLPARGHPVLTIIVGGVTAMDDVDIGVEVEVGAEIGNEVPVRLKLSFSVIMICLSLR